MAGKGGAREKGLTTVTIWWMHKTRKMRETIPPTRRWKEQEVEQTSAYARGASRKLVSSAAWLAVKNGHVCHVDVDARISADGTEVNVAQGGNSITQRWQHRLSSATNV